MATISLTRPKDVLALGATPYADLTPPERVAEAKHKRTVGFVFVAIGVAVVLVIAAAAWPLVNGVLLAGSLVNAQAKSTELLAQQAKFSDLIKMQGGITSITSARATATASEINWAGLFSAVALTLPSGVSITTLTSHSAASAAAGATGTAGSGAATGTTGASGATGTAGAAASASPSAAASAGASPSAAAGSGAAAGTATPVTPSAPPAPGTGGVISFDLVVSSPTLIDAATLQHSLAKLPGYVGSAVSEATSAQAASGGSAGSYAVTLRFSLDQKVFWDRFKGASN